MALEKRTWCYVQPPAVYEMAPCACGNHDTQWSEYAKHLWCAKCEIDFIPKHAGVFDGPIPVTAASMLGMVFDRINLETNEVDRAEPARTITRHVADKAAGCRMPPEDRAKRNIACLIRDLSHCSPKTAGETADWVTRQVLYDLWHNVTPEMLKAGVGAMESNSEFEAEAVFKEMLLVLINSQGPEE